MLIVARVVLVLSSNCIQLNFSDDLSSGRQVGDDIFCFASRIVDEAISEISEFLTDDEVAEVADALHGLVNQWQKQQTA